MERNEIIQLLSALNRYDIECSCGQYSIKSLELSADGSVVKWEDIELIINKLKTTNKPVDAVNLIPHKYAPNKYNFES